MKKKILFLLLVLLFTGCGKVDTNKLENKLQELGNDYFSNYMIGSAQNLDVALISIADLKEANTIVDANYDLSLFKNCEDTSMVKIYLKSGTTQIEKYEFDLKCK